jgi:hypothetical protein
MGSDYNWDGNHTAEDFEDIPPEPPSLGGMAGNANLDMLLRVMRELGFPYTEEPGWLTRDPGYNWYSGAPHGVMVHHTATTSYAPDRAYPEPEGSRDDGKTICNILIQPDGTINFVSADPANYSSGLNWKGILDYHVAPRIRFDGPQSGSLGPEWYGNRAWINIENVHPGDGSPIPDVQERSLISVIAVMCMIKGWDATAVIGHYDGRGTKIDPRWEDDPYRIAYIQDRVQEILDRDEIPQPPGGDMPTHFTIGMTDRFYEPISWLLARLSGGHVDPNSNSGQISRWLPWKTNVKLVQREDLDLIIEVLDLNEHEAGDILEHGLNATGKTLEALRELDWQG